MLGHCLDAQYAESVVKRACSGHCRGSTPQLAVGYVQDTSPAFVLCSFHDCQTLLCVLSTLISLHSPVRCNLTLDLFGYFDGPFPTPLSSNFDGTGH